MHTEEYSYWRDKQIAAEIERETATCKMFIALGGQCLPDGNMFGAVIGDLPTGCSAFEKNRLSAILKCMENFRFENAL